MRMSKINGFFWVGKRLEISKAHSQILNLQTLPFEFALMVFFLTFLCKNQQQIVHLPTPLLVSVDGGDLTFILASFSTALHILCCIRERDVNLYSAVQRLACQGRNDWDWQRDYLSLLLTIPTQMRSWMCHRHPHVNTHRYTCRHTRTPHAPHDSEAKYFHPAAENLSAFETFSVFLDAKFYSWCKNIIKTIFSLFIYSIINQTELWNIKDLAYLRDFAVVTFLFKWSGLCLCGCGWQSSHVVTHFRYFRLYI